jgi:hypothetical protein
MRRESPPPVATVRRDVPVPLPSKAAWLSTRARAGGPHAPSQVGAFLEAAGRHGGVTDEVYEKYAPLVAAAGKRGLPRYRAALSMVAGAPGAEPPTVEAFQAAWEQRRAEHLANVEEAQQLTEHDAEAARIYVTRVRAETGAGPTWAELGEHLGWPERL